MNSFNDTRCSMYALMLNASKHVWRMRDLTIPERVKASDSFLQCLRGQALGATVPAVVINGRRMLEVHGE